MSKKAINIDNIIECPSCKYKATVEEWDKASFSECTSREMKRAYLHLNMVDAFSSNKRHYYMCTGCKQWISGDSLRVYKNNMEKMESIGWKPVYRIAEER